ncbi:hypothetical protein G6011_08066 [Alternaria panax]|nr:hypothetical protein G6011_11839 [Alternaria panax]KAG9189978.1 hypothetical protein G6011_08066 [Alternaria panax]
MLEKADLRKGRSKCRRKGEGNVRAQAKRIFWEQEQPSVQLSREFDAWLGPGGLSGGPIPSAERSGIEASQALRICAIPDLDDESNESDELEEVEKVDFAVAAKDKR